MASPSPPDSPSAPPLAGSLQPGTLADSAAAQAVNDMFDLAAPPLQQPVVARLVPLFTHLLPIDIHQDSGTLTLGRAKELIPPYRIEGAAKLSSRHCELCVDAVTRRVTLRDTSTNGTFVNGKRVTKDEATPLLPGDRVSLTKPTATSAEDDVANPRGDANAAAAEYMFQRIKEETTIHSMVGELTCSVCRSIYLRPCSVLPCMHVFCASCISQWLRAEQFTCPECRQQISEVRPTHKIQSCVDQLLAADLSLRRSAEDLARLTALDDIPPTGKVLRKRLRDGDLDDSDGNPEDFDGSASAGSEERSHGSPRGNDAPQQLLHPRVAFHRQLLGQPIPQRHCRQCDAPSTLDGYQCVAGGPHLVCRACRGAFPERPLCPRPQRCHLCCGPFCNAYFAAADGGCPAQPPGAEVFRALENHVFAAIPPKTFGGNMVEQGILSAYMAAHAITPGAAWTACVDKLRAGVWTPNLTSVSGALRADSAVCQACAAAVFAALLFEYRRAIPADELPESVTQRSNCWYGMQCRTQFHKPQHAQSYNHVCYQEKRKE